ncbi:MAG TPA: protein phosphatase 2C domain-containing protein, partial [Oligoflexia bacterium]|nr:protein phosphatase 2C domain-containing protein [Oligoflexia bacterium]
MLGETNSVSGLAGRRQEDSIPAAITDIGCEREINEDRYAVVDCPAGRVWLVCDGMGGSLGGELAAQLAIDAIKRALESRQFDNAEEALCFAIEEANRTIVLRRQNPAFSSMGTTIVAVIIKDEQVVVTHAGDSRAYIVRGGEIQQLTVDHTYVQDLVDRGAINAEEALSHPQSHVLTRCLGAEPRLELECQTYWLWESTNGEPEDRLVLCSDGLYSLVSDREIAEAVTKYSPQESCVQLVELSKSRGGYDN